MAESHTGPYNTGGQDGRAGERSRTEEVSFPSYCPGRSHHDKSPFPSTHASRQIVAREYLGTEEGGDMYLGVRGSVGMVAPPFDAFTKICIAGKGLD